MSQNRTPTINSRYYVPREEFLTVVHFCRQYPQWLAELSTELDPRRGVNYDQDKVSSSGEPDPTFSIAARRATISRKKDIVEHTAQHVAHDLYKWLLLGVGYDYSFYQLQERGMPCNRNVYYAMRRQFFYELAKSI